MQNMEVTSLRFWGIMSLASLLGGVFAIPVNWWLVKNKLKHGMGTERALGRGGAKETNGMNMQEIKMPDMDEDEKNMADMVNDKAPVVNMQGMNMEDFVSDRNKVFAAAISIVILAIGIAAAAYWGNFSMQPKGDMINTEMKM